MTGHRVAHGLTATTPLLALLRDERLSAHVTSASPAWLCSHEPARVIWANAAAVGANGQDALVVERLLSSRSPLAVDLARLALNLPESGAPRLSRIRGLSRRIGQPTLCFCSRMPLEGVPAVLMVAAERPHSVMPLIDRVRGAFAQIEAPFAIFAPEGALLLASPAMAHRLGSATKLSILGADAIAAEAVERGRGRGHSRIGDIELQRFGDREHVFLMVPDEPDGSEIAVVWTARDDDPSQIESSGGAETDGSYRKPLRFVWQIDAEGRFWIEPGIFAEAVDMAGRASTWAELATEVDPDRKVEHAIASRQTWTAIALAWPVGRDRARIAVELSGAPVFDDDRRWIGYRGFGVCRDVAQLAASAAAPRRGSAPAATRGEAPEIGAACPTCSRPQLATVPPAENVVPFRLGSARKPAHALSAVERTAFQEIGQALASSLPDVAEHEEQPVADQQDLGPALRRAETEARELRAILDTATDGVVVVQRDGRVQSLNRSAEALFGYDSRELVGQPFAELFAPESRRAALDYIDGLCLNGVASVLNDGREVIGRVREGGLVPLFMTMGRLGDGAEKFCAVLRDITQWKRAEEELLNAKREAERTSSAKSDFLAKISHEIRTPLNAIIGFSEVMVEERFGPIANERYRQYLKDIHASGGHLVSLLNDLLDLSKIEAGKLDLSFTRVDLTASLQQCVALMQPQANRERIIIRTSLLPNLPAIVVDERSIRQIVLNLLSNSIKFTGAGGQVIVSTALTEHGEAVVRVRDTGVGMSEQEIETALEPFRQLATSTRWGSGGTGLGLPLTKALAEANRANFTIRSAVNAGTLVEITFPTTRVLAE